MRLPCGQKLAHFGMAGNEWQNNGKINFSAAGTSLVQKQTNWPVAPTLAGVDLFARRVARCPGFFDEPLKD